MSCWVQPSFAAELWGVPLDRVLGRIDAGEVPARTEDGVLLIDIEGAPRPDGSGEAAPVETPPLEAAPVETVTVEGATVPTVATVIAVAGNWEPDILSETAPNELSRSDGGDRVAEATTPRSLCPETSFVETSLVGSAVRDELMDEEFAALLGPSVSETHAPAPSDLAPPILLPRRTRSGPRRVAAKASPLDAPLGEPLQNPESLRAIGLPEGRPRRRSPRGRRPAVDPNLEPEPVGEPQRTPAVERTPEPESTGGPGVFPEIPAAVDPPSISRAPTTIAPRPRSDDEDEMGPDPNFGEVDDGKPLDWRQARTKAAARRRPPPRFG